MSGQRTYVRKRTQDPNPSRSKSRPSSRSSASTGDCPYYPTPSVPISTRIGTTNASLLKFADGTADIPREATGPHSPTPGWGGYYAQEQRLRTEDVPCIEKSGLRSVIDRKTESNRRFMPSLGRRRGPVRYDTFRSQREEWMVPFDVGIGDGLDLIHGRGKGLMGSAVQ